MSARNTLHFAALVQGRAEGLEGLPDSLHGLACLSLDAAFGDESVHCSSSRIAQRHLFSMMANIMLRLATYNGGIAARGAAREPESRWDD